MASNSEKSKKTAKAGKATEAGWKAGRGKLGPLDPLLGAWIAEAETPMGPVRCERTFSPILNGAAVLLEANWHFGDKVYREHAIFSPADGGTLGFWSFTSDGKRSEGRRVEAADVHPGALAFEAEMPAGRARQVYWPADDGGVCWAVESATKKGWKRFTLHTYRRA